MDIYCPVCTEPIDTYTFHDIAADLDCTYDQAVQRFFDDGCGKAFAGTSYGGGPCQRPADERGRTRAAVIAGLSDILGDDIDGLASELEDFEALGLL